MECVQYSPNKNRNKYRYNLLITYFWLVIVDRLRAMAVLVSVAEAGNFTLAAERLGISAVMVGKHIQQLEHALGAVLIERTTRKQRLTAQGQSYYQQCKLVLAQVQHADQLLAAQQIQPSGRLRISAPRTLGSLWLAPRLMAFMAQYPQLSLDLQLNNRPVDLLEEDFDLAVRIGPVHNEALIARRLGDYQLVLAAAPSYLAQHGMPSHPSELNRHQLMQHQVWDERPHDVQITLRDHQRWPVQSRLCSNDSQALRAAALAGLGLIFQPALLLSDVLASGELIPVLPEYWPQPWPIHLLYRTSQRGSVKIERLVSWLQQTDFKAEAPEN